MRRSTRETDKRSPVDQTSRNYQTGWVQREGRSRPESVWRTLCCILGPFFRVFGQGRHKPDHVALYGPRREKTNVLVSDLVRHKQGCTATDDG